MLQLVYGRRGLPMISSEAVAKQVNETLLNTCESLNETVVMVQQRCTPEEFKRYRRAVGAVLAEINDQLLNPLYARHPALEPQCPDESG